MNTQKGFGLLAVLVVVAILAIGGGTFVYTNPQIMAQITGTPQMATSTDDGVQTEPGDHMEVDHEANEGVMTKSSISWKLDTAAEVNGIPQTKVTAVINGESHVAGTFDGSCSEIGESGGIDGKGLVAGELSAVQCYYAGGGNEIGVFAHEDGGFEIMVGEISEGSAEEPSFRGDFKIKASISL